MAMDVKRSRNSTIDTVYEKIKEKILEMEYGPNLHLVEETLSADLNVSRTPLRQALYRLELEGIVVKKTTGRIHVAPLSIKEAEDTFLVREMMEGLIARLATINITKDPSRTEIIQRLQDIMLLMRHAAENHRQVDVVRYGNEFHNILELHSDNRTAVYTLFQIKSRIARYRRIGAYKDPKYPSITPVEEHEAILKHISEGNEIAAEESMRHHIQRSLQSTIKALSYLGESGLE